METSQLNVLVNSLKSIMITVRSKISEIPYNITENFYELADSFILKEFGYNDYLFSYNYFDENHQLQKIKYEKFKDVINEFEVFRCMVQKETKKIENYISYTKAYDKLIKAEITNIYTSLDRLDQAMSKRKNDYEKYKK